MFTVYSIADLDDPRLAPYRTLRAQFDHLQSGVFVAEGEKVVRRLLESRHEVLSVLLPPRWQSAYEPLLAARPEAIDLFIAGKEVLMQLTGFSMYQGLLALARVPAPVPWEALLSLPRPRLFAAVDGLSNAENVGAVARNAAALGVQALLVGETSAHPYLRRAVRSSMGTIFGMPYRPCPDLVAALGILRQAGVRCLAAHPHTDELPAEQAPLADDCCVVLGAEGEGIRPAVRAACEASVVIPMSAGVDSLNVASAAAVLFYEASRQRRRAGG